MLGDIFQIKTIVLGVSVSILFLLLEELIRYYRRERVTLFYRIIFLLFGLYMTFLMEGTISPMYGWSSENIGDNVNLIPFRVMDTVKDNPFNFFGNIIMMIPLGLFLVMLSSRCQKISVTLAMGFCISMCMELLQLFEIRGTDIDDIILNSIGTILGWFLGQAVLSRVPMLHNHSGIYIKKKRRYIKKDRDLGGIVFFSAFILCAVMFTGFIERDRYMVIGEELENSDIKQNDSMSNAGELHLNLEARNAYIYDVSENQCIYEKHSGEKIAPASTAKMLTALTALKYCDEDEVITVGREIQMVPADASKAQLSIGVSLTTKQLLEALLLPSGNDAAYVLAVHTGRMIAGDQLLSEEKALDYFVKEMNSYAKSMGAIHSNFVTPDGYDAQGQYTSAEDLAVIAQNCLSTEAIIKIMGTEETTQVWASGENIGYRNTNELIDSNSCYYRANVIAGKTGTTDKAGDCLVFILKKADDFYVCVVMNSTETGRYEDADLICDSIT